MATPPTRVIMVAYPTPESLGQPSPVKTSHKRNRDGSPVVERDPILYPDHTSSGAIDHDQPLFAQAARHHKQHTEYERQRAQGYETYQYRLKTDKKGLLAELKAENAQYRAKRRDWLAEIAERKDGRKQEAVESPPVKRVKKVQIDLPPALKTRSALPETAPRSTLPPSERRQAPMKLPKPVKTKRMSPKIPKAATPTSTATVAETRDRTVAPIRKDKDFDSLRNICPPLASLDAYPKGFKFEIKGSTLDLSTDPERGLLHPFEVQLASALRLDCASYLTTKRRIFLSRLECYLKPKEFKKTDAQKAAHIDVNKSSKIWEAFESVGWLNPKWIMPYL